MTQLEPTKKKYPANPVSREAIAELKHLAARHGGALLPEHVLEAARNKNSILHDRFEWDTNEAAEKYRLIQARLMLSVAVEVLPGSRITSRVFVSLKTDRLTGGGYRTLVDVMNDSDMHQQMLDDAVENIEHFQEKYKQLKELRRMMAVMDETKLEIRKKKSVGGALQ